MKNRGLTTETMEKQEWRDAMNLLTNDLSGSELNTFLLEVFNRRLKNETPCSLLNKYNDNRLVKPSFIDVIAFKKLEVACYELLQEGKFNSIELSPVAQLGSCSLVASVDQKKVLTALRSTEVLADPTNSIALEYALNKKKNRIAEPISRYGNISRVIRTQALSNPNFTPHFSVLSLTSCGRDTGNFSFERGELVRHLKMADEIFRTLFSITSVHFAIQPCKGYTSNSPLILSLIQEIEESDPTYTFDVVEPDHENNYYIGFRIKMYVDLGGHQIEIGDGGLLNWTQQLLSNQKERMMTMGIGIQVLYQLTK